MSKVTRILLGLATVTPDRRCLQSIGAFADGVARNLPHVEIEYSDGWVWNRPLVDAQNIIAEKMLEGGFDYLLTIEDDHWNFTWQMLQTCLEANTHVAGIPYRSRHFPFDVVPMKFKHIDKDGCRKYVGMNDENLNGYEPADLLGFGFTLIRSDVFRILDRPYFRLNTENFKGPLGPHATDIDFCTRLIDKGIHPIGCFQHRLNHRDIVEDKYKDMLVQGILTQHSMFTTIENIGRYKKIQQNFERNKRENQNLKENI